MKSTTFLTSIALAAAVISAPLLLGGCAQQVEPLRNAQKVVQQTHYADVYDYRMQPLPNDASVRAPAYGWRYFADISEPRAVVISPQGDYYYSRGEGLSWIAAEQF